VLTYCGRGTSGTQLDVLSGEFVIGTVYRATRSIQDPYWSWTFLCRARLKPNLPGRMRSPRQSSCNVTCRAILSDQRAASLKPAPIACLGRGELAVAKFRHFNDVRMEATVSESGNTRLRRPGAITGSAPHHDAITDTRVETWPLIPLARGRHSQRR
jgi:hypothetical protein